MADFIISIHPRYVGAIVRGEKTVEIRRRRSKLVCGDRIWIYSTRPQAEIVGFAVVDGVAYEKKKEIWIRYGPDAAITRNEYETYVGGLANVFAIRIGSLRLLKRPVSLEEVRRATKFHPPQYLSLLGDGDVVLRMLLLALSAKRAA